MDLIITIIYCNEFPILMYKIGLCLFYLAAYTFSRIENEKKQ